MRPTNKFASLRSLFTVALVFAALVRFAVGAAAQTPPNSTVAGTILFDGVTQWSDYALTDSQFTFTFDFCATDRPAHIIKKVSPLPKDGSYSFSDIPKGKYNVYVKGGVWLRGVQALDTTTGDNLHFNFSTALSSTALLFPGDSNQDNRCDVLDFGTLVNAYGTDAAQNNGYDAAADFNYDGAVDVLDFGTLVNAYGASGETFATNLTIRQKNLQPVLTWESIPALPTGTEPACKYNVYRATAPNVTNLPPIAGNVTALSYTDTDARLDRSGKTPYYYRVTAVNTGGDGRESLPSNEFVFKTKSLFRDVPVPGWVSVVPMDSGGTGGSGPSASDSVNLTSGIYENSPGPDIVVRNPVGPNAVYERSYHSGLAAAGYGSPGLPAGWTDNYDLTLGINSANALFLIYPNGATDALAPGTANNTFTAPPGAPYTAAGVPDPNPMRAGFWTKFTLSYADLSKMVFSPDPNNGTTDPSSGLVVNRYLLTEMDNLLGQKTTVVRDPATHRVMEVDGDGGPLLTLTQNGGAMLVTDVPGQRQVQYTFGTDPLHPATATELLSVSRLVPVGGPYPLQSAYHYALQNNWTLLCGVEVPNPGDASHTTQNALHYDDGGLVSDIADANGNERRFAIGDGSTAVTVDDGSGGSAETWTQFFSGNKETGEQDAQGPADIVGYNDMGLPFLPTDFTDKNTQKASVAYETAQNGGKYGAIRTTTVPVTYGPNQTNGVITTTYKYDYTISPLGLLKQVDQTVGDGATRTLAIISYYPTGQANAGQVETIQTPKPGGGGIVMTTYQYTPLGNVSQITAPGPNGNVTYTFGYKDNGKTEALGEPTHVTDPLGHTTYYTYTSDGRGNIASVTLPVVTGNSTGFRTDYAYNTADQLVQVTYPATGQTGGGRAFTYYDYYYEGGGLRSVQIYDENGQLFRHIDNQTGNEGEIKQVSNAVPTVKSQYDPQYRLKQLTDGNNHATTFHFDPSGNPDKMTYPDGANSVSAAFDNDHNVASVTNARKQKTTLTRSTGPSGDSSVLGVTYPAATLPNVTYTYDGYGRLSGEDNGVVKQTYTYDDADNLLTKTVHFDNGALDDTLTYAYNPDGSVASLTSAHLAVVSAGGTGTTRYTYDNAGNLKQVSYPWQDANKAAQSVSYVYDEDDRLIKQTTSAVVTTYAYNARNQRITLDNEATQTIGTFIDSLGYQQTLGNGTTLLAKYSGMKYDGAGNLTQYNATYQPWYYQYSGYSSGLYNAQTASPFNGTYVFGYDGKDRLMSETVTRPNVGNATYPYYALTAYNFTHQADEADNLLTLRSRTFPVSYNADNQFGFGSYDGDGNYAAPYFNDNPRLFDVEDRMMGTQAYPVTYYDDGLRASWYNPNDVLFNNTSNGTSIYDVYDGDRLLYEVHQTTYGSGQSETIAQGWGAAGINQRAFLYAANNNAVLHYAFDPQGSPVNRYNVSYLWFEQAFYDAFGQVRQVYGLTADELYAGVPAGSYPLSDLQTSYDAVGFGGQWGYYTDYPSECASYHEADNEAGANFGLAPTAGLLLLGQRYYEPHLGRFVTRDPLGYEGGINLYAYCGNNPVMNIDPSGLFDFTIGGFEFTNSVVSDGLKTGAAAVGYEFSGGLVGGGYRNHEGFGGALHLAQGADVILTFVDGVGIVSKAGKFIKGGRATIKLAVGTGKEVKSAVIVRYLQKGEKIEDIIIEAKGLTYIHDAEHAVISLPQGGRALVRGGRTGIEFAPGTVKRIIGHTHPPFVANAAQASAADLKALAQLKQRRSYLVGGGLITLIRPR